jgi:ABC-type multidrug transport system fused ATPase/permease subunit
MDRGIHRGLTPSSYLADYLTVLGDARAKLPAVLLLSLAAVALDTLGVGLVAPLVGIIVNGAPQMPADMTRKFVLVSALLVAVFVAKGWLGYLLNRRIVRFSEMHRAALIDRLMGAYQTMDWQTLVRRSSGELVNRVLWWTQSYASGTLSASIRLATDLLVFVCIGALLGWADALAVLLVLGVLGALFLVIHAVVRPGQARAQKALLGSYERVTSGVGQALGALREVRVLGHEAWFRAAVREAAQHQAEAAAQQTALAQVPRYAIEAAMLVAIVGVAAQRFVSEGSAAASIPLLALFAAAAVRLMPAATSLLNGFNSLRATRFVLGELAHELETADAVARAPAGAIRPHARPAEPFRELRVEDLSFRYAGAERPVFENLSLAIRAGEAVGLTGPSGAGKSTLADLVLGFLEPQVGRVLVNGTDIRRDLRAWLDRAAYIPQAPYLLDDSIERNVVFGASGAESDRVRLERAIDMARLREVVDRLPEGVAARVGENGARLSGGERQRVALARALYQGREFLILDESTSALDADTERQVLEAVRALHGKITLLVIAHSDRTLAACDRIVRLPPCEVIRMSDARTIRVSSADSTR